MEELFKTLLKNIGEDPSREGLVDTPKRCTKAWKYITRGYTQNMDEVINGAVFEAENNHMVIVRDIEIYSLCEHHLLPFFGKVHIGYIPKKKIIGVSKLARISDVFARRLQVQERLTHQIADTLMKELDPDGVGVVIEAKHLCMMMRGVEKQNSLMVTSAMQGSFRDDIKTREEFLRLITHQTN